MRILRDTKKEQYSIKKESDWDTDISIRSEFDSEFDDVSNNIKIECEEFNDDKVEDDILLQDVGDIITENNQADVYDAFNLDANGFSQPLQNDTISFNYQETQASTSQGSFSESSFIESIFDIRTEGNKDDEMMHLLLESDDDNEDYRSNHDESDGDLIFETDDIENDKDEINLYSLSEKVFEDATYMNILPSTSDSSVSADISTVSWSSKVDNNKIFLNNFKNNSGPIHNLPPGSSCLSYFKLLFTEDMAEEIRLNTNRYAEFVAESTGIIDKLWTPIESTSEIWTTIAIIFIMSIVKLPSVFNYWSSHPALGNEMVKRIMPRNRFQKIMRYLHLSNREKELTRDNPQFYLLQKLEPFMSSLRDNCRLYISPSQDFLIDEALMKYNGRFGVVHYMPSKVAKHGLRIWMLCTCDNGYVYNFEVHCGRNDKIPCSGYGLGYDVVSHLIQVLQQPYHHIYFNGFFTSIKLLLHLMTKNIYACGTILPNNKCLPSSIKPLNSNKNDIFIYQCNELPNLLCSSWHDKNQTIIVSTNEKSGLTQLKRKNGTDVNIVQCPTTFSNYNKFMGKVDLADQNRKYYSISKKSVKWWFYVFWFLMDIAMHNAYNLFIMTNNPSTKKKMNFLEFKLQVIEGLSKNVSSRKRKGKFNDRTVPINAENVELHKKMKIAGRKRICQQCRRHNRKTASNRYVESSWECTFCNVCLCANCFGPYHEENMV